MQTFLVRAALAAALCSTTIAAAAPGSGDRYRVTTTVRMAGMAMPGRAVEVCTERASAVGERAIPKEDGCQVLDFRRDGSKASYRLVCTGEEAMSGEGEMETLPDGYRGSMKVQAQGEQMTMSYEGKRIGSCDYATESTQAQGKAMLARTCESQLDSIPSYSMYVEAGATCATYKPRFCANVQRALEQAGDPARFADSDRKFGEAIWRAAESCGGSRATVLAQACARAESDGNLDFVGDHCPALVPRHCDGADPNRHGRFLVQHCGDRARAIAAQQCEGRGYTAMRASPYRAFCQDFATERLRARQAQPVGATGPAPAATDPTDPAARGEPPRKPSFGDRLKSLKDRLGGGG